ncbi:hypothetical protein [Micromonospora zamorensis]|uniref:Uncharacterized protein n=1 Tax=Micromonospora zamorensis TaxID=709883 RepID=A0ABZ1PK51_9ACTN
MTWLVVVVESLAAPVLICDGIICQDRGRGCGVALIGREETLGEDLRL